MFDSGGGGGVWIANLLQSALRHLFPKVIHNTDR